MGKTKIAQLIGFLFWGYAVTKFVYNFTGAIILTIIVAVMMVLSYMEGQEDDHGKAK